MQNREIKFRAWWDKEGMEYYENWGDIRGLARYMEYGDVEKVMQYTGLKDKNGKEIYEGDIVSWSYGVYQVAFEHGMFIATNLDYHITGIAKLQGWLNESAEVIGNIYENQELL